MKIFSWVHRQFLHKVAKKDIADDKVALLDQNEAFASACDGWKEGILAIGTFGVDLFQDFKTKEDTFMNNDQVLFFNDDGDHDDDDHVEKQDLSPCDDVAKPNNCQRDVVKDSMKITKSGERTTLADLLRVDSEKNLFKSCNELSNDHKIKVPYHDDDNNNNNNHNGTKSIKSFLISKAKKKLRKDDSAQPMKKTKQDVEEEDPSGYWDSKGESISRYECACYLMNGSSKLMEKGDDSGNINHVCFSMHGGFDYVLQTTDHREETEDSINKFPTNFQFSHLQLPPAPNSF
ncbi:hypothetical protein L1987_57063 [Smallanthus sonchifolius]|uniref:Uncharacterized protein n=1 Tax=Smallanthus sonchifolius TaxID=185202 RepID=A0ACB9DBZ7_9ASTR|nr:hypothetical protein L1987_57063 [Smallanthus sonchifolius]